MNSRRVFVLCMISVCAAVCVTTGILYFIFSKRNSTAYQTLNAELITVPIGEVHDYSKLLKVKAIILQEGAVLVAENLKELPEPKNIFIKNGAYIKLKKGIYTKYGYNSMEPTNRSWRPSI